MKHLRINKYALIRELVFNISTVTSILGLYVAYLLGAERWRLGLSILFFCVIVDNLISRGYLWMLQYNGLTGGKNGTGYKKGE